MNGRNGGESANCGTRHCEIPASAGMVLWGTGMYRQKHARLLPAQLPKYAADSHSPHSSFLRRQESHNRVPPTAAYLRQRCRPWLRDSCLRRNGLVGDRELCADLALLPEGYRPGDSCFRRNGLRGDGSVCAYFGDCAYTTL